MIELFTGPYGPLITQYIIAILIILLCTIVSFIIIIVVLHKYK